VWAAPQPTLPQKLFFPFQAKPSKPVFGRQGRGWLFVADRSRALDFVKALESENFNLLILKWIWYDLFVIPVLDSGLVFCACCRKAVLKKATATFPLDEDCSFGDLTRFQRA